MHPPRRLSAILLFTVMAFLPVMVSRLAYAQAYPRTNSLNGFTSVLEAPDRVYLEISYTYWGAPGAAFISADMGDARLGYVPDTAAVGQNRALVDISVVSGAAAGPFVTTQVHLTMYTRQGTIFDTWLPFQKQWSPQSRSLNVVAHAPKRLRPGENGPIWVRVLSAPDGQPLPNALVTVSVGGGRFQGGGMTVRGRSSADGSFNASWSCSPCAGGYSFDVEAASPRGQARTVCFVRIQ